MPTKFRQLNAKMNVRLHFLHSHLDKFPDDVGDVSDKQSERFHQDIKVTEEWHQGRWNKRIMADNCWNINYGGEKEI